MGVVKIGKARHLPGIPFSFQDVARIRAKYAGYAIPYPDRSNTATRQL